MIRSASVLAFALLFALSWMSGCYTPRLGSPGFHCHPSDNPACPDGQVCVNGTCYFPGDAPGDGGTSGNDGGTSDGMNQSIDLAGGSCVPTGGDCTYHNNSICCSNYCIYKTNTCK